MAEEVTEVIQSDILSDEQVVDIVNTEEGNPVTTEPEVELPSDTPTEEEALIAGKFKSQDDLLKAYQELEKKLGTPPEEGTTEETTTEEPKQEVDEEYVKWKQEKATAELLEPLGGKEVYTKAVEWANETLPKEDITSYNKALAKANGDVDTIRILASSIIEKHNNSQATKETTTSTDNIHSGETTKVIKTKGYDTKSEMMKDMSDPRYERDPSYRDKVAKKVAMTDENEWYKHLPKN